MNTTLRTLLATVLSTAAFIAASPVQAGVTWPNGSSLNGLSGNGLAGNGLAPKAIRDQIPDPKKASGAANARLPQIESIVLKDGRELPAR